MMGSIRPDRPFIREAPMSSRAVSVRPDLVPAELRAAWVDAGHTPGVDLRTLFDEQVACDPDLAVASVGATCLAYPVLYRHNEVRSLLARSGAVACLFVRRLREFDY